MIKIPTLPPLPTVCWAYSPSLTLNGRRNYRSEICTFIQEYIKRKIWGNWFIHLQDSILFCSLLIWFTVYQDFLCTVIIFPRFLPWISVLELCGWNFYEIQMTTAHSKCVKFWQICFSWLACSREYSEKWMHA